MYSREQINDFVTFLTETLAPDLQRSGTHETAADIEKAAEIITDLLAETTRPPNRTKSRDLMATLIDINHRDAAYTGDYTDLTAAEIDSALQSLDNKTYVLTRQLARLAAAAT